MNQYRHGDLFLESGVIPKEAKKKATSVLLEGEATGHAHRITATKTDFQVYEHEGTLFLDVTAPVVPLEHEEHHTIEVPQGTYKITRQREFDPYEGVRNVLD